MDDPASKRRDRLRALRALRDAPDHDGTDREHERRAADKALQRLLTRLGMTEADIDPIAAGRRVMTAWGRGTMQPDGSVILDGMPGWVWGGFQRTSTTNASTSTGAGGGFGGSFTFHFG